MTKTVDINSCLLLLTLIKDTEQSASQEERERERERERLILTTMSQLVVRIYPTVRSEVTGRTTLDRMGC